MSKLCTSEGCSSPSISRGLCGAHYMRDKRAGLFQDVRRAEAPVSERFFRFVDKTDLCWIWTGKSVNKKGYGSIGLGGKGGKHKLAHRLSYEIHKGPIPDGMVVMHKCDNPRCVNPEHLDAGTQSKNIKDAFSRGRKVNLPSGLKGESHGASKLSNESVFAIRASNEKYADLAAMYGVSRTAIERIRYRKTWRHI